MNSILYFISTGLVLMIFTAYYYLFLQHSKNFLFNRIYLIAVAMVSFLITIPGFNFKKSQELISDTLSTFEVSSFVTRSGIVETPFDITFILWSIYVTGIIYLLIINIIAISRIKKIISEGEKTELFGNVVITNKNISDSFTFINHIVVPNSGIDSEIVQHEKAHVKGWHMADLLFAELVCTLLWFVPFIRSYKKAVVMNHEFIADHATGSHANRESYCELLLAQTIGVPGFSIGHAFSYPSLTKTRINMLYKKPMSKWNVIASYLLIIPVLTVAILVSSCKDELSNSPDEVNNKVLAAQTEILPEYPGGKEALMNYLGQNIKYPESAKASNTEGKVFIKFVVTADGKVKDASVAKGVSEDLDSEAMRVISNMPDWKPGTKNGSPVNMQMTIPIMFKLE